MNKSDVMSSDAKKLHVKEIQIGIGRMGNPPAQIFTVISHTSRKEHFHTRSISFLKRQISRPYCLIRRLPEQIILKG